MLDSIINLFSSSSSLPVEDETEGFHRRIAVCVDKWNPSSEVWATLLQLLDKKERARIQRFRKRSDAKESLVGRLLLRYLACETMDRMWEDIVLDRTIPWGRPYVCGSHIDVNVTHDRGWILIVGDSDGGVGVDKQTIDKQALGWQTNNEFIRTMAPSFNVNERPFVSSSINNLNLMWCIKEALVKCHGEGVNVLNNFEVSFDDDGKINVQENGKESSKWNVFHHDSFFNEGSQVAVCCRTESWAMKHGLLNLEFEVLDIDTLVEKCIQLSTSKI